jgi:hypothetical protein
MSVFTSERTGSSRSSPYKHFSQGLVFQPVAQGSSTQGIDSVTWASGVSMWQGNDNTVNQNNLPYPLQKASGADVYRFETRPGDKGHSTDDASVKSRSQLVNSNHPDSFNTNYYTSFGFLIEPTTGYFPSTFFSFIEWQGTQDASPDNNNAFPFYTLDVVPHGGNIWKMRYLRRTSNSVNVTTDPGQFVMCQVDIEVGVRHEMVLLNKWLPGGTGTSNIWLNGTQIVSYSGATAYNDAVGPWLAIGNYHSRAPAGQYCAVQVAHLEHGTTDLSGRVASPLSWT